MHCTQNTILELKNVDFSYNKDNIIFKNLNLIINNFNNDNKIYLKQTVLYFCGNNGSLCFIF